MSHVLERDNVAFGINNLVVFMVVMSDCGGSLAFKRALCHTGRIDGATAPRAISAMAFMN